MSLHVLAELELVGEQRDANGTDVMGGLLVLGEARFSVKALAADRALERPLSRVDERVSVEVRLAHESLATVRAAERFAILLGEQSLVLGKAVFSSEMLVKVAYVSAGFLTHCTFVRVDHVSLRIRPKATFSGRLQE